MVKQQLIFSIVVTLFLFSGGACLSGGGGADASVSVPKSGSVKCEMPLPVIVTSENASSVGPLFIKCRETCHVFDGSKFNAEVQNFEVGKQAQIWTISLYKGNICFIKNKKTEKVLDEQRGCQLTSNLITHALHKGKNQQFIVNPDGTIGTGCSDDIIVAVNKTSLNLRLAKKDEVEKLGLGYKFDFIPITGPSGRDTAPGSGNPPSAPDAPESGSKPGGDSGSGKPPSPPDAPESGSKPEGDSPPESGKPPSAPDAPESGSKPGGDSPPESGKPPSAPDAPESGSKPGGDSPPGSGKPPSAPDAPESGSKPGGDCGLPKPKKDISGSNAGDLGTVVIKCRTSCKVFDGSEYMAYEKDYKSGYQNQLWTLSFTGSAFIIINKKSGKVLDEQSGCGKSSKLITYAKHGGKNQQFLINPDGTIGTVCNKEFVVAADKKTGQLSLVKKTDLKKLDLGYLFDIIPVS